MSLIHKKAFTYDELISCAKGELFGPKPTITFATNADDRPHYIHNGNGGQFDKGYIEAELDIYPDLWFFPAILKVILLCQAVSAWMACGSRRLPPWLAWRSR